MSYELRISDWSSDVCSSDLCTWLDPSFGRSVYRKAGIAESVAAQDVTRAVTDALVLLFGEGAGDDADGVSELGNDRIVRREVFLSDRVGLAFDDRRAPHLQNGSALAVVADISEERSVGQ